MGCLGVHFALTEAEVLAIKAQPLENREDYFRDLVEETYFEEEGQWMAESDKAWDAMHRALTDGKFKWGNGTFPLSHVILGGEDLYECGGYIMSLKTPAEVQEISNALRQVPEERFRENYFRINPKDYGFPVNEEDYGYTWLWFEEVQKLYYKAAEANRYVLFTASQ